MAKTTKTTTSPSDIPIQTVFNDIQSLEQRLGGVEGKIGRLFHLVNVDQREQRQQDGASLLEKLEENTILMKDYLSNYARTRREKREETGQDYFIRLREMRAQRVAQSIQDIERLSNLKKKRTAVCPCGAHKGIAFLNDEDEVILELCPVSWWRKQARLALDRGKLKEFNKKYLLPEFLEDYALKEGK